MSLAILPGGTREEIERNKTEFVEQTPWAKLLLERNMEPPKLTEIVDRELLDRQDTIALYAYKDIEPAFRARYGLGLDNAAMLYGVSKYFEAMPDEYERVAGRIRDIFKTVNL